MKRYLIFYCSLFLLVHSSFSQTNVSGVISTNTTWTKANSPYNINGNTQISAGVTLTIDPGVRIIFNGDFSFKAFGPIIAVGSASDSIYFETNSSGTKIGKGIYIRNTATANFDLNYNYLSGTRFKYCSFNNLARGIFNHESGVSIENCGFYNNDIAWEPRSNLQTLVSNSVFKKNSYALFTYGEDQTTGDNVACIKDILITNNEFNENGYGISIGMNQRTVTNFKVTNNKFYKNTTIAVSIGGGGYGPYVGDNVEISFNKFIENTNAITAQVYNLGYNGCSGGGWGTNSELLITKNSFYKDQNAVNLNGIAYANVMKNVFDSNQRGVYIGTNSDRRSDNTIQINQFFKVEKPVVIYANGIYYQTDNNTIKRNTFQSFLLNQSNPIISINTRVNNNRVTENNFSLYNGLIISNTDIGNVPFSGNYTLPSRTLANDINDQNDNIDLGLVQISSAASTPVISAPISMPTDIVKSLVNGRVVLSWSNGSISDFSGSKIYYGGYSGYSYSNVIDAGTVSTYTLPVGVSIDEDIAVTNYDASADGNDDQFDGNESWYSPANKAPNQVVISAITPTERQIQLNWSAVSNANKYIIYKSTDSSTFTQLTTTTSTSYTDQNLNTLQQRYYYKVSAFDSLDFSYTNYGLEGAASLIKGAKPTNKPSLSSIVSYTDSIKLNFSFNSNLSGINAIKVYRASATESRAVVATLTNTATTYTDNVSNGKSYTYDITISNSTEESDPSTTITGSAFTSPSLVYPILNQYNINPADSFKISKPALSTKYTLEYDTVNTFNSSIVQSKSLTDTSFVLTELLQNQNYFWRVRGGDDNGLSSWSNIGKFQTYVKEATLDTIIAGNRRNTLKFSLTSNKGISKIYILRDTVSGPTKIIDSSSTIITQYLDTNSLELNKKYYYAIRLLNTDNIQSAASVVKFGIPYNTKPRAISLSSKTFDNVGDFNTVRTTYSASGSTDTDGKISNYIWYVNDSLVNSTDSILIYYYSQGTNNLKLVITDNDGAKDSSQTTVTLKSFDKKFKGGILGGITALNPNTIFTADSTFDATNGASIYKLDKSGNTVFSLVVSSKIYTTPSVSSDSSVFITSGTSLNGFNKAGAPLWSTIPLGGLSQVTPTVDSVLSRIYVGVSNKNFFGIDYRTGKVIWNVFCDAPINASAVISGDRKLVFVSEAGTLYGFDIRSDSALTVPKWKLALGEIISKSAAVDAQNNFYFGTKSGNLLKIKLNSNGIAEKVWSSSLTDPIESSPVIDSKGNVYIGTTSGKFHKLSSADGKVIWTYETSGSIKSTPAITEYGTVIFATTSGYVVSLDTLKKVKWVHKESSPISSNLLYIDNMTYVGTESGSLVAIFDNPNTNTVNTSLSKINTPFESNSSLADVKTSFKKYFNLDLAKQKNLTSFVTTVKTEKPVWGTFQGDYRRTGSMSYECPAPAVVNVPDCKFGSDSIIISTSSMQNRYWIINDQILKNLKDSIIKVSANDSYKVQSFNEIGCVVTAIDKKLINLGVIKEKPTINTNTGSYKFCIGDSLVMSSSISAKNYKWYFSGFEISSSNSKSLTTNISGAYSLAVYDSLGCKAVSDVSLVMATNPPTKPAITRAQLDLVSSNSAGNQWYLNNEKISGATSQTFKPLQSGNYKVKTILNGCESALSENYYYLTTAISNLSNDEFVTVSPNPTNGYLRLAFTLRSLKTVELFIHDMSGNVVLVDRKAINGSSYHLDKFSSGNYVLVLKDKQGKVLYTQKIIKN